jgi:hypothetical protein
MGRDGPARRLRLPGLVLLVGATLLALGAIAASGGDDREIRTRTPAFEVDGTRIIDPNGDGFIPVGVNMLGPDGFFNPEARTLGEAEVLREAWSANTVRLNACLPEGCRYTGVHNRHNNDLDAIVEEYTGEGLVLILAMHQIRPGEWPDERELDAIDDWWRDVASRYADNTYVWFNLLNEPGSDDPVPERWLDIHQRLLDTVRDTGAENIVVVNGSSWGQEAGGRADQRVDEESSAILSYGDRLEDPLQRLVFDLHVYDQWGYQDTSDERRDARLSDFIRRVHALGRPLLIGELGGGGYEPCCAPEALGAHSAYRVAPRHGVGLLAWHGQGVHVWQLVDSGREDSAPSDIDDWSDPTNLTWQGQLIWDLANREVHKHAGRASG